MKPTITKINATTVAITVPTVPVVPQVRKVSLDDMLKEQGLLQARLSDLNDLITQAQALGILTNAQAAQVALDALAAKQAQQNNITP